jgi:alkanesulfonate monooxygenase SsuD/methylene tetrahydromethanopterin reductase-like flavin-dependent oxidoreductase (luciferase family)
MKFGIFYEWPNPQLRDWKTLFDEGIEQIQLAEEMGYDFVIVAEHHFSNYGMSPAPLLQAMAIAERTKRLRIATAVLVLPEWQPLRLAEEVAVLDNLTGGRFICGIGRGYQPYEFGGFGYTLDESRGRFQECLDVLLKAWMSETDFTYDGEYVKVPNARVVWPKPLQKPHPPLWLAGNSADSLKLCAERDIVPIVPNATVRESAPRFLSFRRDAGKPADRWELGCQTVNLVADSEDEARASMSYARWQIRANRALNRLDVKNGAVNAVPVEGEADDESFFKTLFYGNPDQVTAKYRRLAANGATFASTWMMVGGIERAKLMKSIRLMGEHVIPALRDVQPPSDLADRIAEADLTTAGSGRQPGRSLDEG